MTVVSDVVIRLTTPETQSTTVLTMTTGVWNGHWSKFQSPRHTNVAPNQKTGVMIIYDSKFHQKDPPIISQFQYKQEDSTGEPTGTGPGFR